MVDGRIRQGLPDESPGVTRGQSASGTELLCRIGKPDRKENDLARYVGIAGSVERLDQRGASRSRGRVVGGRTVRAVFIEPAGKTEIGL